MIHRTNSHGRKIWRINYTHLSIPETERRFEKRKRKSKWRPGGKCSFLIRAPTSKHVACFVPSRLTRRTRGCCVLSRTRLPLDFSSARRGHRNLHPSYACGILWTWPQGLRIITLLQHHRSQLKQIIRGVKLKSFSQKIM